MADTPRSRKSTELDTPAGEFEKDIEKSAAAQPEQPAEPVNPRSHISKWRWVLTMAGLYIGALLYGLDTTIAADVQGPVYESLGEIQNLPWVGLGFPMASVATILFIGRSFGLFEIKALMLTSIFIFEVGSALCGASPSMNALIVGCVIAGIGGAGMYLGALTYISVFSTNKEAALYNASIGLAWGTGAILGPVIGGAFSDSSATWRWAFYINLPLAGIFAPVYFFMFPTFNPRPDLTFVQKLREIDWVGAVLNGAVFVLFMVVVSFAGSTYAWDSGSAIALWVVLGVVLVTYIVQQGFALFTTREKQIFPVHFLKSRSLVLLYIATASAAAANAITLYYIPLYFQFTNGDSALKAAVRLLPFILVFVFFVMLAGGSLPAFGYYQVYYVVGGALTLIGASLMFTIDVNTAIAKIYGYEVLIAAGTGLVFQNAYAVAAAKVAPKDRANAIGFINVSQIGTIAFALAIAGSLFQNLGFKALKKDFASFNFPDDYVRSALAGSISPIFTNSDAKIIEIAVASVATTIQRVFGAVVGAGALLFVSAVLMRFEKLDLDVVAGG